jgi:hypothetical protein
MEKDFVPYEIALELKQLGFDEPCFGYWKSPTWLIEEKTRTDGYTHADQLCSAPTYSQAFRFFREKYNLIGWIEKYPLQNVYVLELPKCTFDEPPFHKTYEKAELACVRKLIEIVKQTHNDTH